MQDVSERLSCASKNYKRLRKNDSKILDLHTDVMNLDIYFINVRMYMIYIIKCNNYIRFKLCYTKRTKFFYSRKIYVF